MDIENIFIIKHSLEKKRIYVAFEKFFFIQIPVELEKKYSFTNLLGEKEIPKNAFQDYI